MFGAPSAPCASTCKSRCRFRVNCSCALHGKRLRATGGTMAGVATANQTDVQQLLCEPDLGKKAAKLQWLAQQFRLNVLDILHERGTGHWGGAASAAELLTALYFEAMNVRPEVPLDPDRDRLLLSKGHASCM